MMQTILRWMKALVAWLEGPQGHHALETAMALAAALMETQEAMPGRSGESKRHQVLAALMKSGLSESDAAIAIELVVQARKGIRWVRA